MSAAGNASSIQYRTERLDRARPPSCELEVPPLVGVEGHLGVAADRLAQQARHVDCRVEALRTVARAGGEEPFLMVPAGGQQALRLGDHRVGLDGEPETAAVGLDRPAGGAAEQLIDRRLVVAAAPVPQRVVDLADRHHVVAGPRVAVAAIHLVPDGLDGERVLADHIAPELLQDRLDRFRFEAAVQPFQSVLRADAEVVVGARLPHRRGPGRRRRVRRRAPRVVDVQRGDLPLPVEPGHRLDGPRDAEHLDRVDDAAVAIGRRGRCGGRGLEGRRRRAGEPGGGNADGEVGEQVAAIAAFGRERVVGHLDGLRSRLRRTPEASAQHSGAGPD